MEDSTYLSSTFEPVMSSESPSRLSTYNPSVTVRSTINFSAELFLSVFTVLMNILILKAFNVEKRLRTYSNQYVLNMAVSDLLVGFIMAIRSTVVLYDRWIFGEALFLAFRGIQNIVLGVSVLALIAICLDRYIAARYPLQHFKRKGKRIAHLVNGITWVISTAFWLPVAVIWDLVKPANSEIESGIFLSNYSTNIYSSSAITIARFGIPFVIITTVYMRIYFLMKSTGSENLIKRFKSAAENGVGVAPAPHINSTELCLEGRKYVQRQYGNTPSISFISNGDKDADFKVHQRNSLTVFSINTDHMDINAMDNPRKFGTDTTPDEQRMRPILAIGVSPRKISAPSKSRKGCGKPGHLSTSGNRKVMRTLTFTTVAFLVAWLPGSLNMIYINLVTANFVFTEFARWMTYSNSLLNPVACAFAQPLLRKTIMRIARCHR